MSFGAEPFALAPFGATASGGATQGFVRAPSPLGAPSILAINDFTGLLDPTLADRYVMDLIGPGGTVRVPISSWQATIQSARANFVQCVVPAATPYMSAINAASEFVVLRRSQTRDGDWVEHEMARAALQTTSYDRGPYRGTATLSGYTAAVALSQDAPPVVYSRALPGVRSISVGDGGVRARCAIDWLLRPGHTASADGETFVVGYINYYVNANDSYCDVGERV